MRAPLSPRMVCFFQGASVTWAPIFSPSWVQLGVPKIKMGPSQQGLALAYVKRLNDVNLWGVKVEDIKRMCGRSEECAQQDSQVWIVIKRSCLKTKKTRETRHINNSIEENLTGYFFSNFLTARDDNVEDETSYNLNA